MLTHKTGMRNLLKLTNVLYNKNQFNQIVHLFINRSNYNGTLIEPVGGINLS